MTSGRAPEGRDWEATLLAWSKPPSDTEDERCENASRMVREALVASRALASRNIEVFGHGSYRNSTNVRLESDVDVCICCMDAFYPDYTFAPGTTSASLGLSDSSYTAAALKTDVETALRNYFGSKYITRGNKVLLVRENTYRVSVDVAPTFERRRYYFTDGQLWHDSGTILHMDRGGSIDNWPHQHYDNGVAKNERTGRCFKAVVRVLKRLRDDMAERRAYPTTGVAATPSFLLESLVWNVPDDRFDMSTWIDEIKGVLAFLYSSTLEDASCREFREVSDLKYLFRGGQKWTRGEAFAFISAAWNYTGFG